MSDENTITTAPTNTTTTSTPDVSTRRNSSRGSVGEHNIKGLYHSFQRREGRKVRDLSLKDFAHQLAENGSDEEKLIALSWIANKTGALEKKQREERQKNKGFELATIRQATKNAKRK